jgi:hypothetical protein
MKTLNILIFTFLSLVAFNSYAQSNTERPVSKDVQKIANGEILQQEKLLIVLSLDASNQASSKDVQFVSNKLGRNGYQGNVKSAFPLWAVAKEVNKISIPKKVVEPVQNRISPNVIVRN